MITISRQEVMKIAQISQIAIHEKEVEAITAQLDQVLTYARCVAEIKQDVQGISRINKNIMRNDVAVPCNAAVILAQAPERADNFFVVPAILETV